MLNSVCLRRNAGVWLRRGLTGVVLCGSLAAALAFRSFFARPGEGALRYIPKDATIFGTMDLSPSPAQSLVFKKIDDALSRNGLADKIQGSLVDLLPDSP